MYQAAHANKWESVESWISWDPDADRAYQKLSDEERASDMKELIILILDKMEGTHSFIWIGGEVNGEFLVVTFHTIHNK